MSLILSIDTTQPDGSIALLRDGDLLQEVALHAPSGFAEIIYPALQALLADKGLKLADIDTYAVASGPGSFTGVRIGLAVAKGCAEMHGKLVVPVSNLLAIAAMADLRGPVCAIIDVRRGEFAAAVFDADLTLVTPPFSATPAEIVAAVPADIVFAGPDAAGAFPRAIATSRTLASAIARLAAAQRGVDPALADAEYVRRADVREPAAPA